MGIEDGARKAFDRSTGRLVLLMRLVGNFDAVSEGVEDALLLAVVAGRRAVRGLVAFSITSVDREACATARVIFSRGSVRDSVRRGRASEGRCSGRRISVRGANIIWVFGCEMKKTLSKSAGGRFMC